MRETQQTRIDKTFYNIQLKKILRIKCISNTYILNLEVNVFVPALGIKFYRNVRNIAQRFNQHTRESFNNNSINYLASLATSYLALDPLRNPVSKCTYIAKLSPIIHGEWFAFFRSFLLNLRHPTRNSQHNSGLTSFIVTSLTIRELREVCPQPSGYYFIVLGKKNLIYATLKHSPTRHNFILQLHCTVFFLFFLSSCTIRRLRKPNSLNITSHLLNSTSSS